MAFQVHPRLQADCHPLGQIDNCHLLLHKNALLPWFILLPETTENELYKLTEEPQRLVYNAINRLSAFVEQHFDTDKLNVACIGNIVPQLHIHIIGRYKDDFCWPEPVWGQKDSREYEPAAINSIKQALIQYEILDKGSSA